MATFTILNADLAFTTVRDFYQFDLPQLNCAPKRENAKTNRDQSADHTLRRYQSVTEMDHTCVGSI